VQEDSPNRGVLMPGDLILKLGRGHAPHMGVVRKTVLEHKGKSIDMLVLRDGEPVQLTATLGGGGQLGVLLGYALDSLTLAAPIQRVRSDSAESETESLTRATPIAPFNILPGTLVTHVGDVPVDTWRQMRETMKSQTMDAFSRVAGAPLELTIVHPTPGSESETLALELTVEDVAALHRLGWGSLVSAMLFEPLMTVRQADNPIQAIGIGIEETRKTMMLTYLTIDRLIRGSVGVEQLRGPVGIVHIGSKIADRGFIYVLYFLAIISVNLAVINFLPLPIVDGGLFLFLIYEKFKGRPPSAAFQHWATVAGLFMIGTAFLVVTWNDVMRLLP
jgi:regulator of sigma E protease